MYIPVNFLESKRITKLKFKIVAIIVKQQQPEEYSIFVCNESDLSQSVVVSVIVRSDRPWMAMCPSAATWWAAIIRAPWWYGVLPVITTPTIWGFLSTLKWRVSGWIPCIASWTDSWIIIAAWPSTFIVPWVCCRHQRTITTVNGKASHTTLPIQDPQVNVIHHCNCSAEY